LPAPKPQNANAARPSIRIAPFAEGLAMVGLDKDLAAGVRIVSHNYEIPGWDGRLVRSEIMTDEKGREHKIHLYRMPVTK
jgi:hypothetical protein